MTQRLSTDLVREEFKSKGFTLLGEYKNRHIPVKVICSCGRTSTITYGSFKRGSKCLGCSGKRKLDFEFVKSYFEKSGCKLLETEYKDAFHPIQYICSCGNEDETFWNNFQQGRRCQKCRYTRSSDKLSGSKNYGWIKDRDALKLRRQITRRAGSMLRSLFRRTGKKKNSRTELILGYKYKDLQTHLTCHSNWATVSLGEWHIDHIYPVSAFLSKGITDFKLINCLENLRPLSKHDNSPKNNKHDKRAFEEWLTSKGVP